MSSSSNTQKTPKTPLSENHENFRAELRQLEATLLALQRRIELVREPVPERAFAALDVRVGQQWYALVIEPIAEVLPMVWPRLLPDAPRWVRGCIDIGATVVPMIDLQQRLEGHPMELGPSQALVLVETASGEVCALAVADLGDVHEIDPADISPPPAGIPQAAFVLGALSEAAGQASFLLSAERLARAFVLSETPGEDT